MPRSDRSSSQGLPENQLGNLRGNPGVWGTLTLVPHSFLGKPRDAGSYLSLEEHKVRATLKTKSGVESRDVKVRREGFLVSGTLKDPPSLKGACLEGKVAQRRDGPDHLARKTFLPTSLVPYGGYCAGLQGPLFRKETCVPPSF